jgi:hypothetical protein
MLLASDLNDSASLPDIYFIALTGDAVYTRDLQTQFVLDRIGHVDTFSGRDVDGLDVMFGQQSYDLICHTVLVRQHGYTGQLLVLLLRFMSGIYCPTDLTITSQP